MKENFKNLNLTAVWDEDEQKSSEFRKEIGVAKQAASVMEVAADSHLIIMDVKSSDTVNYACEVLKQGVPLYVSKPLANNLDNALKIIECARTTGTPLLSSSPMRYDSNIQETLKLIQTGELGNVHLAFIALHHTVDFYLTTAGEWHVSLYGGGGPLFYLGVHGVDILDELVGLEDIEQLYSSVSTIAHGNHHIFREEGLADTHAVNISYKNGMIATLQLGNGVDYCYYGGQITGRKSHHIFETQNNYVLTIEKLIEMVESKKSPLALERMEQVARILDMIGRSGKEKSVLKNEK